MHCSDSSPRPKRSGAFSLVELSIVLVILGLLTGGVLAGQSLIRAAELRSVTSDIARFNTAARTFQDKYFALPGDLTIATKIWGSAGGNGSGTDAACWNASQTGPGTCNGNGDGVMNSVTSSSTNPNGEQLHFWKQMADAGLIEGTYTGFPSPPNKYTTTPGVNVPASKLGGSGFSVMQGVTGLDDGNWYPLKLAPLIMFGGAGVGITENAALKPEEAWNIDVKTDDGKPGLGNTRTHKKGSSYTPNCTDGTDPNLSNYALTNTNIACNIYSFLL